MKFQVWLLGVFVTLLYVVVFSFSSILFAVMAFECARPPLSVQRHISHQSEMLETLDLIFIPVFHGIALKLHFPFR